MGDKVTRDENHNGEKIKNLNGSKVTNLPSGDKKFTDDFVNKIGIAHPKKKIEVAKGVANVVNSEEESREIMVEIFSSYSSVRWRGLNQDGGGGGGGGRGGQGVKFEYGRMLRPPYHLVSVLRVRRGADKGDSFTDRNTMVFVVLSGKLKVTVHTSETVVEKGDCFYVPPKNSYNISNVGNAVAELVLVQYQYDGPLPEADIVTK